MPHGGNTLVISIGKKARGGCWGGKRTEKVIPQVLLGLGQAPKSKASTCYRKDPGQGFGRSVAKTSVEKKLLLKHLCKKSCHSKTFEEQGILQALQLQRKDHLGQSVQDVILGKGSSSEYSGQGSYDARLQLRTHL